MQKGARTIGTTVFLLCITAALFGDISPHIMSKAAAVYEYETGTLLYEKNGDLPIPPASMTTLMTLHLAFKAIESGEIDLNATVTVEASDDFTQLPRRSSLMFLEEGQEVTLLQLMQGLAVPSGNDAALMLARLLAGSVDNFVELMNQEVSALGYENIYFDDPAGLSEKSYVTAKEFGLFCCEYIRQHPESLKMLHTLSEFTYPPPGVSSSTYGPITQENYNVLVGRHPWVDGLKTGYIDESGYNISLTARADGRRLVAVVLGGPGESGREGALTRAIDGVNLLSYGFYHFTRVEPQFPTLRSIKVWRGVPNTIQAKIHSPVALVLPLDTAAQIQVRHQLDLPLEAPLEAGAKIGETLITSGDTVIRSYPIRVPIEVKLGSWWRQLVDSIGQLHQ